MNNYRSDACLRLRSEKNLEEPFTRGDSIRLMKDRDIANFMVQIEACHQGREHVEVCQQVTDGLCYECWMHYLTRSFRGD